MKKVFVTNYKAGFKNELIENIHPNAIVEYPDLNNENEISVNNCLFIHVFDTIPFMRNIPVNKPWFTDNLYHYTPLI